ncbi:hypothetical protein PRZ48_012600 [Zasmidium cellare]|uniref:F-box domain-containing protein n=1 Tax=Zasmidium cellare TaxID=395010 RepID=A0ABR0E5H3_ZASCE|nr:hypothetical protein PRZ48_012600 [Zasmidium cellare]
MLSEIHRYNHYWRLSNWNCKKKADLMEHVQSQGRHTTRYMLKWQLIEKQNLTDRGLLPYENPAITLEELQRFIRDRRLQPPNDPPSRADCIAVLEKADESQTFDRFLDLPPELRERIYGMYMAEFPRTLTFPTQPPLTLTSRLLRKEALPLFFKETAFNLYYCYNGRNLQPCLETNLFLANLPMGLTSIILNIGYYQKTFWNGKRETIEYMAKCTISLSESSVDVEIVGRHHNLYSKVQLQRLKDGLEKKLKRNLKAEEGIKELRAKDVAELVKGAFGAYHTWAMQNPARAGR